MHVNSQGRRRFDSRFGIRLGAGSLAQCGGPSPTPPRCAFQLPDLPGACVLGRACTGRISLVRPNTMKIPLSKIEIKRFWDRVLYRWPLQPITYSKLARHLEHSSNRPTVSGPFPQNQLYCQNKSSSKTIRTIRCM